MTVEYVKCLLLKHSSDDFTCGYHQQAPNTSAAYYLPAFNNAASWSRIGIDFLIQAKQSMGYKKYGQEEESTK